jgi:phospholipid/cholesterol/gamma-HCH transport system ATP-binding protein
VAIARAMAARPTLLLYDEATTGLDPMTALTVDSEVVKLRDLERVTSVLVTHQLRDAFYVATHQARRESNGDIAIVEAGEAKIEQADFVMIREGRVFFEGTAGELRNSRDPYLQKFLS